MLFCTGVGRKNVLLVEELRVRGSWNTSNQMYHDYQCIRSNYRKGLRRLMKCSLVQA